MTGGCAVNICEIPPPCKALINDIKKKKLGFASKLLHQ